MRGTNKLTETKLMRHLTVCSHSFNLFLLRKTSMSVETYLFSLLNWSSQFHRMHLLNCWSEEEIEKQTLQKYCLIGM